MSKNLEVRFQSNHYPYFACRLRFESDGTGRYTMSIHGDGAGASTMATVTPDALRKIADALEPSSEYILVEI